MTPSTPRASIGSNAPTKNRIPSISKDLADINHQIELEGRGAGVSERLGELLEMRGEHETLLKALWVQREAL